jgi:hypothetical protein
MVIAQLDHDQAVLGLVNKLDQVYGFMIQDKTLGQMSSMCGILGQISQQTLECACFIRDYFLPDGTRIMSGSADKTM